MVSIYCYASRWQHVGCGWRSDCRFIFTWLLITTQDLLIMLVCLACAWKFQLSVFPAMRMIWACLCLSELSAWQFVSACLAFWACPPVFGCFVNTCSLVSKQWKLFGAFFSPVSVNLYAERWLKLGWCCFASLPSICVYNLQGWQHALTLQEMIGWGTSQSPFGEGTPEDGSSTSTVQCTGYAGTQLSPGI